MNQTVKTPDHAELTDKAVKQLALPVSGAKIYYDARLKGFGVRVTAKGARSFILNYRTRSGRESARP